MHPNPIYRRMSRDANLAYAARAGFGMLAVTTTADAPPLVAHVPFVLDQERSAALFHLVRSNPIWRALDEPRPCRMAVQGPHGYVSPDWYGLPDQVPTWNYVAVHLVGHLERLAGAALEAVLERQSAVFEAALAPKPAWTIQKMDGKTRARMMRAIAPCRLVIEAVDGTWKLGQNKPDAARIGAAEGVRSARVGLGTDALAALMTSPPDGKEREEE